MLKNHCYQNLSLRLGDVIKKTIFEQVEIPRNIFQERDRGWALYSKTLPHPI